MISTLGFFGAGDLTPTICTLVRRIREHVSGSKDQGIEPPWSPKSNGLRGSRNRFIGIIREVCHGFDTTLLRTQANDASYMIPAIHILNGPNLDLLGQREPDVYGSVTLMDIETSCRAAAAELGVALVFRQTAHEGTLIEWIHTAGDAGAGVILNAGAYTHTSIALHDAIRATRVCVIEVHVSNVFQRESFRHMSYISPVAVGLICGLGPSGYEWALHAMARLLRQKEM